NAELLGLERLEVETIAQVARGHRKQAPKPSELDALPPRVRPVVRGLAAVLRVADALDRTHSAAVRAVRVRLSGRRLVIDVEPRGEDAELEVWAAARRTDLLPRLLDRPPTLPHPTSPPPAP